MQLRTINLSVHVGQPDLTKEGSDIDDSEDVERWKLDAES